MYHNIRHGGYDTTDCLSVTAPVLISTICLSVEIFLFLSQLGVVRSQADEFGYDFNGLPVRHFIITDFNGLSVCQKLPQSESTKSDRHWILDTYLLSKDIKYQISTQQSPQIESMPKNHQIRFRLLFHHRWWIEQHKANEQGRYKHWRWEQCMVRPPLLVNWLTTNQVALKVESPARGTAKKRVRM